MKTERQGEIWDNEKTERLKDGKSGRWIWKMGEWNYGMN